LSNHTNKTSDPTGDVPAPTVHTLLRGIRDAEVIHLTFPHLQRALLVDPRLSDTAHPTVRVAPLGFGAAQHRAAVQALRPDLPLSERVVATVWGGSTRAFAEQGVLPAILNRLSADGRQEAMVAFAHLPDVEQGMAHAVRPPSAPATARAEEEVGSDDP
jgi:hypothetical protein